jgi:glycerol uptake facilitator protein
MVNISKTTLRDMSAEFLGTMVLMLFGLGVNAQVTLGKVSVPLSEGELGRYVGKITEFQYGDYLSINFGWGVGVMLAVYVAGGVTGAHINPAVTIAMACRRALPWNRVVPFIAAQMLGAFVASAIVYGVYYEQIQNLEVVEAAGSEVFAGVDSTGHQGNLSDSTSQHTMATAGIFATYPRSFSNLTPETISNWTGLLDQIVGTAILLLVICAVGDVRNLAPQSNIGPMVVGALVLMIGLSFGSNCGYAINPARDLSPRLFTYVAGWGSQVFKDPNTLWYLVPVVGPIIGGITGVFTYDQLISRFHESEPDELEGVQ